MAKAKPLETSEELIRAYKLILSHVLETRPWARGSVSPMRWAGIAASSRR